MWWRHYFTGVSLFAVALLPPWQVGEGERAPVPLVLTQQNAPGLPLMPMGPAPLESPTTGPTQVPGTPATSPATPRPRAKPDCIWKVIEGLDKCFCRPAGSTGARAPAPDSKCG